MSRNDTDRPPTLGDLAKAAGVSKGTASNVFNRPDIVRAEVRERVLEVARSINYAGPDPKGRLLGTGRVNAIGVATTEPLAYFFDDPFARILMKGIAEACDAEGLGVSLISASDEADLAWNMHSALVDGFVLFCLTGAQKLIAQSRERRLPFVALDFGDAGDTLSAIGIDNVAAARRLARHLLDLGHRRFAVLAMDFDNEGVGRATMAQVEAAIYTTSRDRVIGTFRELEAAGIDTAGVPIFETTGEDATVGAALEEIFAREPVPTALVAQSDRIALLALDWLKARGLAVPGDVSLVGFDGVPEGETSDPPLTTMRQPIAELGRRAVRAIVERPTEIRRETLETELVVRGSTAPPPAS